MKVLNFGSLNLDYVYNVEHFVREGETILSTDMNIFCGGKGLNQSVALAKAGAKVYHAGAVGTADGGILIKMLESAGVNTVYIKKYNMPSGHAIIQKNIEGNNCILLYGGANQNISQEMIDEVLKNFESGDILLLQNEISNLKYLIERAYKMGMRIVLNPSPVNKQISDCDLNRVEYLILNEIEAADILGIDKESGDILIDGLSENFPDTKIVLTLGENGSIYLYKGQKIKQEIYKTKVVDTTAAGDTFTGYFIAGVSSGISVEMSLKQAAKAASLAVSKKGASPSIPFIEEVIKSL